jgi:hypothetical protein
MNYKYKLSEKYVTRTEYVRDLGVLLDFKLPFHHYVDYIFSQSLKMLGLKRTLGLFFSDS